MCERKLALYNKKEVGELEPHTVLNHATQKILERRLESTKSQADLLFPAWCPATVNRAVKQCAKAFGWPGNVIWDGSHCARHGSATDVKSKALAAGASEEVANKMVQSLAWQVGESTGSAKRYGTQHREAQVPKVKARKGRGRAASKKAGAGVPKQMSVRTKRIVMQRKKSSRSTRKK